MQLGGQTPLNLARPLVEAGVKILGTSLEQIDRAEDREKFVEVSRKLNLTQPPSGMAEDFEEAKKVADGLGYPVLVRPSYVLGGRAMAICYDESMLEQFIREAAEVNLLKQVPSCEFYPIEAVQTNILGADNVMAAAVANGVENVVVLSTDKAVYPINAMG